MIVKTKDLIKLFEKNCVDEIELTIGSGKREFPVDDILVTLDCDKLIFSTKGYANWVNTQKEW